MAQAALKENPAADVDDAPVTGTSIVEAVRANPTLVLIKPETFEPFYAKIREEVLSHVPDLTTAKGRDAISALAYKVTRTKTAIDSAGKLLNEERRKLINVVDASRRDIRERLDALADQARKPLTEWEEAEGRRIDRVKAMFAELDAASIVPRDATGASILAVIAGIEAMELPPAILQDRTDEAVSTHKKVLFTLGEIRARILQEEADRAELARLREEQAQREREKADREAAERAEAKRKADQEAAEQRRRAAEDAERERIAAAEKRAEEAARTAVEQQARAQREAMERDHAAAVEKIRREAAEAEVARRQEIDRQALAAKKAAEDDARRAANKRHRAKIMGDVHAALLKVIGGDGTMLAMRIADAIAAGDVPHTTIQF